MNRLFMACVWLGMVTVGVPALGQQPQEQAAGPLAGRRIGAVAERSTLVSRDFQGVLRLPEPTIVEAAAKAVNPEGDEKERVEAVLRERARVLDAFVEENLDLLTRFGAAEHSADGKEKLLLAIEAFSKLRPLREKGPLDGQVRAALSKAKAAEFDALLRGYWDALAADDKKQTKPKGRLGAVADAKLKDLGREIEAAFHRAEKSGGVLFGYLFRSMKLTQDQKQRLHELCAAYSVGGLDNKEKAAQAAFFLSVTQVLDPEQRKEFGKRIAGKK